MMFTMPKVYQPDTLDGEKAGGGFAPPADAVEVMMKFNEQLAQAGALVALDGLHPPQEGARVAFRGEKELVVTDGPLIEGKEVVGRYWIIDAVSREEAVQWAGKCPAADGDVTEIRPIFEMGDFPDDVRKAAENPVVEAQLKKHTR